MMLLANKHQPPKRDFKLETLEIPKYSAEWFHVTIHVDLKANTFYYVLLLDILQIMTAYLIHTGKKRHCQIILAPKVSLLLRE